MIPWFIGFYIKRNLIQNVVILMNPFENPLLSVLGLIMWQTNLTCVCVCVCVCVCIISDFSGAVYCITFHTSSIIMSQRNRISERKLMFCGLAVKVLLHQNVSIQIIKEPCTLPATENVLHVLWFRIISRKCIYLKVKANACNNHQPYSKNTLTYYSLHYTYFP
jgi:hypothetical protein